jgi:hypothetical protein
MKFLREAPRRELDRLVMAGTVSSSSLSSVEASAELRNVSAQGLAQRPTSERLRAGLYLKEAHDTTHLHTRCFSVERLPGTMTFMGRVMLQHSLQKISPHFRQ